MNITITGSSGFLGTHLMTKLHELGYSPYGVTHKAYDLRSEAHVNALFKHCKPDVIYHLAAHLGGISYNLANPASLFYDNVKMNTELIHKAMLNGVKRFIMVGSVCSYPAHSPIPTNEKQLWQGYPEESNGAYGVSKLVALEQLQAYHKQYGFNFAYPILANLYGPGDVGFFKPDKAHLIPSLIKQFGSNPSEIVLSGKGELTRDLLYVSDAVNALICLLNTDYHEPVNIATGKGYSKAQIVDIIASLFDYKGDIIFDGSFDKGQLHRRYDTKSADKVLNWHYKTDLKEGLEKTIKWCKETFLN